MAQVEEFLGIELLDPADMFIFDTMEDLEDYKDLYLEGLLPVPIGHCIHQDMAFKHRDYEILEKLAEMPLVDGIKGLQEKFRRAIYDDNGEFWVKVFVSEWGFVMPILFERGEDINDTELVQNKLYDVYEQWKCTYETVYAKDIERWIEPFPARK